MTTALAAKTRLHGAREVRRPEGLCRPLTDIFETDKSVFVVAEIPGVIAENVDITVERRILTIHGRRDVAEQPVNYRRLHTEYDNGDYERVFAISEDINKDQIKANYRDGVLLLELPKATPVKTMKVNVNA